SFLPRWKAVWWTSRRAVGPFLHARPHDGLRPAPGSHRALPGPQGAGLARKRALRFGPLLAMAMDRRRESVGSGRELLRRLDAKVEQRDPAGPSSAPRRLSCPRGPARWRLGGHTRRDDRDLPARRGGVPCDLAHPQGDAPPDLGRAPRRRDLLGRVLREP